MWVYLAGPALSPSGSASPRSVLSSSASSVPPSSALPVPQNYVVFMPLSSSSVPQNFAPSVTMSCAPSMTPSYTPHDPELCILRASKLCINPSSELCTVLSLKAPNPQAVYPLCLRGRPLHLLYHTVLEVHQHLQYVNISSSFMYPTFIPYSILHLVHLSPLSINY